MRISIRHETRYQYSASPTRVTQILRLTPRDHDGQYITSWRVEVDRPVRLSQSEDAFGNITHTFTAEGGESLTMLAEGEVQTHDANGMVTGTSEKFAPELYLRETPLTKADSAITSFAKEITEEARGDRLNQLHVLLAGVHRGMIFDARPTDTTTTAAEAFAMRRGVCQDLSHVFIAAARSIGIPARYVSGYFRRIDGVVDQEAGHAWVEAYVTGLGWVGFDPANGISVTDAHARVAMALDYLGAAPIRGTRYGGGEEVLNVFLKVQA
ncbi:transglutaminase [Agaricicola taiwanensis]|uniref:Transglutaminase n=1 Tax=Agaricicola taiwanensis TaxID=591372 RepID=A0A8J2W406_9RHOB|nr:transglutaminase family protein [Agaricicola taiwanensis]GGE42066.1 transglutaminase [Agaricicola taiwanensis]